MIWLQTNPPVYLVDILCSSVLTNEPLQIVAAHPSAGRRHKPAHGCWPQLLLAR